MARINYFNDRVDGIRARCQLWLKNIIDTFRRKYVKERREARIFEIHSFVENQRKKLKSYAASRSVSTTTLSSDS